MDLAWTSHFSGRCVKMAAARSLVAGALLVLALPGAGAHSPSGVVHFPIEGRKIVRIVMVPASFRLDGPIARQRVLVTGERTDGSQVDLTDRCKLQVHGPAVSLVGAMASLRSDGAAVISATFGRLRTSTPVTVEGSCRRPRAGPCASSPTRSPSPSCGFSPSLLP